MKGRPRIIKVEELVEHLNKHLNKDKGVKTNDE